jgi:hypothetical protein
MKFDFSNEYRKRAEHCSQQSHLTKDAQLKKYWEELAMEWLALENVQTGSPAKAISSRVRTVISENIKERVHE